MRQLAVVVAVLCACGDNDRVASTCGDGVVDEGEQCDDANTIAGDGCAADCVSTESCGNGVVDSAVGELCDDGNTSSADGCAANCRSNEQCGNGVVDASLGEVCDDANTTAADGCSTDCKSNEQCGNGVIDLITGDECDAGLPGLSRDGCSSLCKLEAPEWEDRTIQHRMPPRAGMAIAYDGARNELIMFGGATTTIVGDTRRWNGATWVQLSPAQSPPSRRGHTLTFHPGRQTLILFGGEDAAGTVLGDMWEWNGTSWAQLAVATPPARRLHGMAHDDLRGRLVLFGGQDANNQPLGDTWEWDATAWQLITPSTSPSPRYGFGMVYADAQGVVVISADVDGSAVSEMWSWNGTQWTLRSSQFPVVSAEPRTAAYDRARGLVVVNNAFGIIIWDGTQWLVQEWGSWTAGLPPLRRDTAMAYHAGLARTFLFGGASVGTTTQPIAGDTWSFDGTTWREEIVGAPSAREGARLAYDPLRQRTVLFGGDGFASHPTDTWEWDGSTWALHATTGPPSRDGHGLAYTNGKSLLFGGRRPGSSQYFADTWEWDGVSWTQLYPTTVPPAQAVLMSYDRNRDRAVMVPMMSNGSTWEWTGANWSLASATTTTATSASRAMSYDERRAVTVLVAGRQTWEWDGISWMERVPVPPAVVYPMSLVYDPNRGTTVLVNHVNSFVSDLWEWDGMVWNEIGVLVPRWNPSIAFHAAAGHVVAFGGFADVPDSAHWNVFDTWVYEWRSAQGAETCTAMSDSDGDTLGGCQDPDCWTICTPLCPPYTTCDSSDPHCGDGTCSSIENASICPADCP